MLLLTCHLWQVKIFFCRLLIVSYQTMGHPHSAQPLLSTTSRSLPLRISGIYLFRWFAAIHIVWYHVNTLDPDAWDTNTLYTDSADKCELDVMSSLPFPPAWGRHWVMFFFILSGFGVGLSACRRPGGSIAHPCFDGKALVRRLISLIPIYWTALAVAVAARPQRMVALTKSHPWSFVLEVFALQTWEPSQAFFYSVWMMLETGWCATATCFEPTVPP